MRNDYLKYIFKPKNTLVFILFIFIIGVNKQIGFLIVSSLILSNIITTEYLNICNMMRKTRKEIYKNISIGIFLLSGMLTLLTLFLERIIQIESFLSNDIIGMILMYFLFMFNLLLGVGLAMYEEKNINSNNQKKGVISLLVVVIIILPIMLVNIGLYILMQSNIQIILMEYKLILGSLMILLLVMINLKLNKLIKKSIIKKEWN